MSGLPRNVGLGEIAVSHDASDVLVAYGLGSCVAIGVWDPRRSLGGLLHAVLPERTNGAERYSPKFVDSGIEGLLAAVEKAGADRRRLVAWMAGGANMLANAALSQSFEIGTRNVTAALHTLQRLGLSLHSSQVGGNCGRTVRLYIGEGRMTVRVVGGKEAEL